MIERYISKFSSEEEYNSNSNILPNPNVSYIKTNQPENNKVFYRTSNKTIIYIASQELTYNFNAISGDISHTFIKYSNPLEIEYPKGSGNYCQTQSTLGTGIITFQEELTTIPTKAFQNCTKLNYIYLPESVTSLGPYAFEKCSNLRKIKIPSQVTEIPTYCFQNCNNLASVGLSSAYSSVELHNNITKINHYAFFQCFKLNRIELPNSLTYIGQVAFAFNYTSDENNLYLKTDLCYLYLGNSLENLGNGAFNGRKITEFKIPDTIKTFYGNPVKACNQLESIQIVDHNTWEYTGESLLKKENTNIPRYMDYECNIVVDNQYEDIIDNYAITGISNSSLPNNPVKDLNSNYTSAIIIGCKNFINDTEKLNHVKIIGDGAFRQTTMTELNLPYNIIKIKQDAFRDSALTKITWSDDIQYIHNDVFRYCTNLTTINNRDELNNNLNNRFNMPKSLIYIGEEAFFNNLTKNIVFYNNIKRIKARCFYSNPLNDIYINSENPPILNYWVNDSVTTDFQKYIYSSFTYINNSPTDINISQIKIPNIYVPTNSLNEYRRFSEEKFSYNDPSGKFLSYSYYGPILSGRFLWIFYSHYYRNNQEYNNYNNSTYSYTSYNNDSNGHIETGHFAYISNPFEHGEYTEKFMIRLKTNGPFVYAYWDSNKNKYVEGDENDPRIPTKTFESHNGCLINTYNRVTNNEHLLYGYHYHYESIYNESRVKPFSEISGNNNIPDYISNNN